MEQIPKSEVNVCMCFNNNNNCSCLIILLIILLLFIGSLIMISLGIIGYYIARIYDEVKGRPRYIIEEYRG